MSSRPLVIGIAGGIGSGKSSVARAFAALGCFVSDSDAEARACLLRRDVRETLTGWWGPGVLDARGEIDRGRVASIVFADPEQRRRLEGLVHPILHGLRRELIAEAGRLGARAVIVDAPLLFEAGIDAECDAVVFVEASRAVRLARVAASRGWDGAELDRREAAQWSIDRKRAASDVVVMNEDRPPSEDELRRILDRLAAERGEA